MNQKPLKPGFVRVLMANHPIKKNKTMLVRAKHAADPNYLTKHGMIIMPQPVNPIAPEPTTAPVTPLPQAKQVKK